MGLHTVDRGHRVRRRLGRLRAGAQGLGLSRRLAARPRTRSPGEVPDNRAALLNFDGISYAKGASALRQLLGASSARTSSSPGCAATSTGTPGATPRSPTCSPRSRRRPDATSTRGAVVAARRPGTSHAPGARRACSRATTTARTAWASGATPAARCAGSSGSSGAARLAAADRTRRPGAAQRRRPHLRQGAARRALAGDGAHVAAHPRRPARPGAGVGLAVGRRARRRAPAARPRRRVVLANVEGETDSDLVGALLAPGRAPRPCCGPAPPSSRPRLHEHQVSRATEPGSDLQLVFFRAAVATAPGQAADLPDGLTEDEDLRWLRLRRLAELGQVDGRRARGDVRRGAHVDQPRTTSRTRGRAPGRRPPRRAVWAELTGAGELSDLRGPARSRSGLLAGPGRTPCWPSTSTATSPTCPASGGAAAPSRPQS